MKEDFKLKEKTLKSQRVSERLPKEVLDICKKFEIDEEKIDWDSEFQSVADTLDKFSEMVNLVAGYSELDPSTKTMVKAELLKENIKKAEQLKEEISEQENEGLRKIEEQNILNNYKDNFDDDEIHTPNFEILKAKLRIVCKGISNAVFIHGGWGTGKSYATIQQIKKNNTKFREIDYIPTFQLIKTLWELRDQDIVVVFHEAESLWRNENTSKILRRVIEDKQVSYETSQKLLEGITIPFSLPNVRFIFLSNSPLKDKPLLSRMLSFEYNPSYSEMITMMKQVCKKPSKKSIANKLQFEQRKVVYDFIKLNSNEASEGLSLRTFEKGCIFFYSGEKWEDLLRTDDLIINPTKQFILDIHKQKLPKVEQIKLFNEKTGLNKTTYYNLKKEMGLTRQYGK